MSVAPDGLALLASGLWGTSDFLGGSLSRRLRTLHVVVGSQVIAAALVLAALAVVGLGQPGAGWQAWSVLAGVSWAAAMACFYSALAMGSMGVVAPIASTGAVVPVVAGVLQGERPGPLALAGVAVAILGVVAAAGPSGSGGRRQRAAVGLAALTALLFGVEIACLAQGSRSSVPLALVGMRMAALACTVPALLPALARARRFAQEARRGRHRATAPGTVGRHRAADRTAAGKHRVTYRAPGGRDLPALVALGVLDALATGAYAVAARGGLLSLVAVLASLYPAVTVLLARRVHGERLTRVQGTGVLAVLLGVGCIAGSAV